MIILFLSFLTEIISQIILTVAIKSLFIFSNFSTVDSLIPIKVSSDWMFSLDL